MDSNQPSTERRRSERILESLPLTVRGIDLLGQPFEERSTTLAFNLHGCRYTSKHHLPRNTWVTLDVSQSAAAPHARTGAEQPTLLRARVAWVQRPHSIRDFFQIAVELEGPANVWGLDNPPADWIRAEQAAHAPLSSTAGAETHVHPSEQSQQNTAVASHHAFMDTHMTDPRFDSAAIPSEHEAAAPTSETEAIPTSDSPLLRELRAELDRQAKESVAAAADQAREEVLRTAEETDRRRTASAEELFAKWKSEIEQLQSGAREEFFSQVSTKQEQALRDLHSEFEGKLAQSRELMGQISDQANALRSETGAAREATMQVAQALLQLEAVDAARASRPAESSKSDFEARESATGEWRERLEAEMAVAQGQWNELLQSSLDSNLRRMVEQLAQRSQEVLQAAEQRMTERLGELRQPFAQAAVEARDTFTGIQSSLDQEVARARESLTAVELVANRTKELSAQLEAASHDTVNELHRRLEKILDAQTMEMNRRAEGISAGIPQRVAPALDSLSHHFLERMSASAEAKLAPHMERVPALLHELSAREVEVEESLRLHRERLRQVSEKNQREVAAHMATTLSGVQEDFETARKEALTKWAAELDASGVRAAHAAGESIGHTSEWLQQEARARLQAQVEQSLVTASAGLEQKTAEAAQKFEAQLAAQTEGHLAQIRSQVENVAGEVTGRARTELDRAAEAAAASFGQVLHELSERETTQFAADSSATRRERTEEFDRSTQELLHQLDVNAWSTVERFRSQMASQVDSSVNEGRAALSAEFATSMEGYRAERDSHQQEWLTNLDRLSGEAAGRFQEKLQNTADSWVVGSVRRLNEHGQNSIESLLRSADQALRDSCSKVFEGLAEMLRERASNAAGAGNVAGFAAIPSRDTSENSGPHNEAR
ncbi:MAG: hypothetical protein WA690_01460 [Candidatus Acidiferrales bacterium]